MDQPDGQDLGQLNGDDKGEGGDDLECNDELPERREPGPKGFKLVFREKVMKGSKGQEMVEQKTATWAERKQRVNRIKTHHTTSKAEAPYKKPSQIKTIFMFFIKQLAGLKDPKGPALKASSGTSTCSRTSPTSSPST